jgi:hypothetical protein
MRVLEPWVEEPLRTFLDESGARLALLMTTAGQVVAQHGFTRSLDLMSAAALGAGIQASTEAIARLTGAGSFGALVQNSGRQGLYLAAFDTPRGRWIGLAVYGEETSVGLVQLFFGRMAEALAAAAPPPEPAVQVLAENFEHELNASLRALFGR